jgi:hypothetical protein
MVLHRVAGAERCAAGMEVRRHSLDARVTERPEREVHQVDAEVHDAAAARQRPVVEPGLVRPVGVVEDEVGREDPPQFAGLDEIADAPGALGEAVGQVHRQQPVRRPCRLHHRGRLRRRPAERLLAEHRRAGAQRGDGLPGMQRGGRRDDHAIEAHRQHLLERRAGARFGCQHLCLGRHAGGGVADRHRLRYARLQDRLHPVPADPADAEEAEPRPHGVTTAFRKPSGLSRVASSASASRSRG